MPGMLVQLVAIPGVERLLGAGDIAGGGQSGLERFSALTLVEILSWKYSVVYTQLSPMYLTQLRRKYSAQSYMRSPVVMLSRNAQS